MQASVASASGEHESLVTIREACSRLSCSRPTVYELMKAGRLRSVKIGSARRIPVSEIDRFVREGLQ